MKLLLVDDSSTMRKIMSLALSGLGHSCVEADNGSVGLEKARAERFDAILLDINMPVMNGIDFLRSRKDDPTLKQVPVLVLTTQDEAALKSEAFSLGATSFLAKPFQKEALLAAVASLLGA